MGSEVVDQAIVRWRELLAADPVASDPDGLSERLDAHGLIEEGRPLCRVLRPRFVTAERHREEQTMAELVVAALRKALATVESGAIPDELTGGMRDFCRQVRELDPRPEAATPLFLRLDASLARTRLHVMELNSDMPAGEAHNDSVADLFDGLAVTEEFGREFGGRMLRMLPAFDRVVDGALSGAPAGSVIAWVIWDDTPSRIDVLATIAEHLERRGRTVHFVDPRRLETGARGTSLDGAHVGLVIRTCFTPELLDRPDDAAPLLEAARAGTPVINPLGTGPLGRKALLALVTDPGLDLGLSAAERRAVDRHVPWTRLLREGRSTGPHGESIDLMPWVHEHRARLVLKPVHGFAARGVVLGWRVSAAEWEDAIRVGLDGDVVQERVHLQREPYPILGEPGEEAEFFEDTDPFLFDAEASGVLARLSPSEITNVTAGGGVTATMVLGGA